MSAPERLSAAAAIAELAEGRLSAEALARACLERAQARAAISAWASLDPERALALARALDRRGRPGILKGLPVGIKDVIDTADLPTEHGSPIYRGNRPFADAACVAGLRAEGGLILGKTVTTEFANRFPGATRNPHNEAHTPGGSSSGSAAAVADFEVPAALGTQTGGSVIRPAAFCGIVGYKPSFGEISRVGVKMQSQSLDTVGILCRSLEDLPFLRGALLALEGRALAQKGPPRIGFCRTPVWEAAEEPTKALLERTASRLSAAGARVSDLAFPPTFAGILEAHERIFFFEAARNYAYEFEVHAAQVSEVLRTRIGAPGRALPLALYIEALEKAEAFRAYCDDLFAEFDLILAPSAAGEAPFGLESTGDARFNAIWTLAGTPSLTLPAGRGEKGLPLGVQLIGRRYRDETLLEAAYWVSLQLD